MELLPCPFCGAEANLVDMNTEKDQCFIPYWVQCANCLKCEDMPMTAEYKTKEEAINAWNTRMFYEEDEWENI